MKRSSLLSIVMLVFTMICGPAMAGKDGHGYHDDSDALEIQGQAELLLGLRYSGEGIDFQVPSTGCTEKSHFVVQRLSPESQISSQLLLIRVVPDYCDAFVPFGVRIAFSYEELGLEEDEPFTLLNPLSSYRARSID